MLRDRVSGQSKGTGFVRFARTEDASLAIEEMNGKTVPGCPAPLEVSRASFLTLASTDIRVAICDTGQTIYRVPFCPRVNRKATLLYIRPYL